MSPTEIWLRLMEIQGLCGEKCLRLARFLQTCPVVDHDSLLASGLSERGRRQFTSLTQPQLDSSLHWLAQPEHHLLTADSPDYPQTLYAINAFPCALFVAGALPLLAKHQLAVVGSRQLSDYGERHCREFSGILVKAGLILTSGLAVGIDSVAHRAALRAGGQTIAVLGNGLSHVYPRRHQGLARQIIEQQGAVLSEFPLACPARPGNFPWRNRVISGLSRAVLVIEAGAKSGSLITARYAIDQGREVFAIPGPLGSPGSDGPHYLIQQGAQLVRHPQDILDYLRQELNWLHILPESSIYLSKPSVSGLPIHQLLANVGDEVTPVDVVAERAGQPVPETVAQLLELELAGWIAAVPGGYVRLRRASHVRRTNVLI